MGPLSRIGIGLSNLLGSPRSGERERAQGIMLQCSVNMNEPNGPSAEKDPMPLARAHTHYFQSLKVVIRLKRDALLNITHKST